MWIAWPAGVWKFELEGHTDDRLDPLGAERFGTLQRAEEVVRIGDAEGRHAEIVSELGQLLHRQRPFRQGIGRMGAQVDEGDGGIAHG